MIKYFIGKSKCFSVGINRYIYADRFKIGIRHVDLNVLFFTVIVNNNTLS